MIIFGSRTMESTKGKGSFHCPRCSTRREYTHKSADRWFTLYFIPLIPLGSAGQFIACNGCGGTFGTEAINHDPAAERAETMACIRRTLALFLMESKRSTSDDISALVRVFQEATSETVTEQTIRTDMQQAAAANVRLGDFAAARLANLTEQGKWLLLQAAAGIVRGRGAMTPDDRAALQSLCRALRLPNGTIDSLLQTAPG